MREIIRASHRAHRRRRVAPPSQAEAEAAVAEFLRRGGTVTECPPGQATVLSAAEAIDRIAYAVPAPERTAPLARPGDEPRVIDPGPRMLTPALRALPIGAAVIVAGDGTARQQQTIGWCARHAKLRVTTTQIRGVGVRVERVG